MTKNVWTNLEKKIGIMLFVVAAFASVGIFLINYSQFYSVTMGDLKQDAISLHSYAEEMIDIRVFTEINTVEDQQSELYINTQKQLNEIRRIANAKFLYTMKLNDKNEYIYLVDGLDKDDENFSHAGMLVEEEFLAELAQCINEDIITGSEGIMVTDYGYLYSIIFPFHDSYGNVVGAVGVDFDSEHLYHSLKNARRMSIFFIMILGSVFLTLTLFTIKRIVRQAKTSFNKMEKVANEAHELTELMLDTSPICTQIWDKKLNTIDCNKAAVKLYGFKDKQEYKDEFIKICSPEYQPDGQRSDQKAVALVKKAFEEGYCCVEWMHQMPHGTPIPAEVTLVRVKYLGDDVVAGYTRDLREQHKMAAEIKRRNEITSGVNKVASLLLTVDSNENAQTLLIESLKIIGQTAYADRVHIWQNEMTDGRLHYACTHSWFSEAEEKNAVTFKNFKAAYSDKHLWGRKVMNGEYINSLYSDMPSDDREYFKIHGASLKSAAILPLFLDDQFWGMLSIDHCKAENKFTEEEIEILRSVGLMIVTIINRIKMREEINIAYNHTKILLDKMPMSCQVWDKDFKKIDCNEEAMRLFGFTDKQDYLNRFRELYPEYQPDGTLSVEKAKMFVTTAFENGDCGPFDWTYRMPDGTFMASEVFIKRIKFEDEYVAVGYTRDTREQKKLMDEIQTAYQHTKILLDRMPMSCQVWDKDFKKIDCNEEALRLFGFTDKQDYLNRFHELYPEYQPDGTLSVEKAKMFVTTAFENGDCGPFDWTYRMPDDTFMSTEVFMKRVKYEEDYVVVGYTRDMREQKKLMESLVCAKELAEHSSRAKSVFLSQMSHEIRTPMNAILGIAEIMLRNKTVCGEAQNGFTKICESGNLLLNIINNILDFSNIDAGKLEIAHEKYGVADLINNTAQLSRQRYDGKPIEMKLLLDKNTPAELIGDEPHIRQIINNLLSNAYKYTDSGEICFSVSAESESDSGAAVLVLQISDTGQGMNRSQLDSLYDAYARFNLEKNTSIAGIGLGMNITKRLIDAMNGEIDVKSEVGKGTVFTVRLPQKIRSADVCGADVSEKLRTFSYSGEQASNRAKITYKQISGGKVLIVDDIKINLLVAQGLLEPYKLRIETAANGLEAVEKINNGGDYDIVFMDHMMPVMDGMEAVKILREKGYTRPIVAVTANAVSGQDEMFLSNGFDAFVAKPIDPNLLDSLVTKYIKNVNSPHNSHNVQSVNNAVHSKNLEKTFVLDAQSTISVLEKLSAKLNNLDGEELKSYVIAVHGIKSALAGIGERELSALAYKLEHAGGEKNYGLMASDTPLLTDALLALVKKLKTDNTEYAEKISSGDMVFLRQKLDDIKSACESFNIKAAKKSLSDLRQKALPRAAADICEEISIGLLRGEFKKVLADIEKIAGLRFGEDQRAS